jgi:gliding motility associated protien GldN
MKRLIVFLGLFAFTGASFLFAQPKGIYEKDINDKTPVPYSFLREADVMWSKKITRIVDLREKMNLPLYYPTFPIGDRKSLIDVIMEAVRSGEVTVYKARLTDDEMIEPTTLGEIEKNLGASIDSNWVTDPVTNQQTLNVSTTEANTSQIKQYLVQEEWYFDKKHSVMKVRILGLCPIRFYDHPDTGEPTKSKSFWVYFPELRNVLARSEVYNKYNDAHRVSFDDMFMQRRFSSFIIAESNVYNNRQVTEYETGRMALLEADKIKESLINFEHDLWEY